MRCSLVVGFAFLSIFGVGCGHDEAVTEADGPDDSFLFDPKADTWGIGDSSGEACGVLALASEATQDVLDGALRLDKRAAANIVAHRRGPDGVAGTADDEWFDSLEELDAIKYVGKVAFSKLLNHVRANNLACTSSSIRLVSFSDFHGQLDSVAVANVGNLGGAAALATYFASERAADPGTVVLSGGDLFGASPPLAMYFQERPAVETANLWRLEANAVGNHEFDRGLAHLQSMIEVARFPFLSANLANLPADLSCPSLPGGECVRPYTIIRRHGLKIAVVGITTTEAPDLVKPGNLGTIQVTDPVVAATAARAAAAAEGAKVFVALAHLGATPGVGGGDPTGPLVDFASKVPGFDVVVGGHTHNEIKAVVGGVPVVETKSQGLSLFRTTVTYDYGKSAVTSRNADLVTPVADAVPADAAVVALLAPYRSQLASAFDGKMGVAGDRFERGNNIERLGEVPIGDLITDALRVRCGTQIAITNGGGIRAPLPSSYLPADKTLRRPDAGYAAGPPYDLVVGDVYAVLPFGNAVATKTVTGSQIWTALEHGVDSLPAAKGYFPQVSGFRFVFDSTRAAGSRVVSVTLDAGAPIIADTTSYTMTTNDFMAAGGDGYTMFAGGASTAGDPMAEVVLEYIKGLGTLTPQTSGRIIDQKQ
jgi:5'-nucleotidase